MPVIGSRLKNSSDRDGGQTHGMTLNIQVLLMLCAEYVAHCPRGRCATWQMSQIVFIFPELLIIPLYISYNASKH